MSACADERKKGNKVKRKRKSTCKGRRRKGPPVRIMSLKQATDCCAAS